MLQNFFFTLLHCVRRLMCPMQIHSTKDIVSHLLSLTGHRKAWRIIWRGWIKTWGKNCGGKGFIVGRWHGTDLSNCASKEIRSVAFVLLPETRFLLHNASLEVSEFTEADLALCTYFHSLIGAGVDTVFFCVDPLNGTTIWFHSWKKIACASWPSSVTGCL